MARYEALHLFPLVGGVPINGTAKSAQWQSFGNWFLYQFGEKLTGVWRSEVFWDQQGARTGAPGTGQRVAMARNKG